MSIAHICRFEDTGESVWGLKNVHFVGECVRLVDKNKCKKRIVRFMPLSEVEITGKLRKQHFWPKQNV